MVSTSGLQQQCRRNRPFELERLAEKIALKEAYMALQGRAAKRAFNIEHGRYNVGRKAARN